MVDRKGVLMKMEDLIRLGFAEAGTCALDARLKSGVRFQVKRCAKDRVIYAFAVNGVVKYVGVCDNSGTCFANRMSRYQGMMGAGTNKRIAGYMRQVLAEGAQVAILVWRPAQKFVVGQLPVDLVKGLENPLISLARPEWNIHS
jgi:hypothetical protein